MSQRGVRSLDHLPAPKRARSVPPWELPDQVKQREQELAECTRDLRKGRAYAVATAPGTVHEITNEGDLLTLQGRPRERDQ